MWFIIGWAILGFLTAVMLETYSEDSVPSTDEDNIGPGVVIVMLIWPVIWFFATILLVLWILAFSCKTLAAQLRKKIGEK